MTFTSEVNKALRFTSPQTRKINWNMYYLNLLSKNIANIILAKIRGRLTMVLQKIEFKLQLNQFSDVFHCRVLWRSAGFAWHVTPVTLFEFLGFQSTIYAFLYAQRPSNVQFNPGFHKKCFRNFWSSTTECTVWLVISHRSGCEEVGLKAVEYRNCTDFPEFIKIVRQALMNWTIALTKCTKPKDGLILLTEVLQLRAIGARKHRQPKLRLRGAIKSLFGNGTKRLNLPQIRKKSK